MPTSKQARQATARRGLWVLAVAGAAVAAWVAGRGTSGATAVTWRKPGAEQTALRAGTEAPEFALRDRDGEKVALSDFRGRRLALVFTSPECPYCKELAERIADVRPKPDAAVQFISSGAAQVAAGTAESGRYRVLVDTTGAVGSLYNVSAVPMVYTIDAEGRVEGADVGMPGAWNRLQALMTAEGQ